MENITFFITSFLVSSVLYFECSLNYTFYRFDVSSLVEEM